MARESSAYHRAKQCSIKGLRNWFSTINSFFTVLNTLGRLFNEVQLRPRFRKKSLNMQISSLPACRRLLFPLCRQFSSLVGYFKKANAYLVFFIRFNETVHDKWCLHKSVGQPDNGLERVFDTG